MNRKVLLGSILALTVTLTLLTPQLAHAQRGGRGMGGGGRGVGGCYGGGAYGYGGRYDGYRGGWEGNRAWYNFGVGPAYYGYGGYNYGPGYSDNYAAPSETVNSYQSFYRAPSNEPANAARLRVMVPANARVWLENQETTPQGTDRLFYSPSLTPGKDYIYTVKAQWTDSAGQTVNQERQVRVKAGDLANVNFLAAAPQQ